LGSTGVVPGTVARIMASNQHHSQGTASNCYSIALWVTGGHKSGLGSDRITLQWCATSILSSPDVQLMHLLRYQSFYAAYYRFTFEAAHIPGTQNEAVDAISCTVTSAIPSNTILVLLPFLVQLLPLVLLFLVLLAHSCCFHCCCHNFPVSAASCLRTLCGKVLNEA